jgi:peroxiredoxin
VSVWRLPPGGAVPHVPPVVTVAGTQDVPGGRVREFSVPTIDASNRISLSQDAGRPLVMTFYTEACDCDPHLTSMERFHLAHTEVRVLAIDSFTGSKPVRNVVKSLGLTYDVGVDQLGRIAQSFADPSPLPFTVMRDTTAECST